MSSTLSTEAMPTNNRTTGGHIAKNNPGGLGNPFARQTAALRAYLIAHVTERDIQDILDILLLNAKGGHLPTIKLLFSYVLGKPKPVVEPDLLDLQELQMMQQGALAAEALETLCDQLPLNLQVQLTHFSQAENAATVVQATPVHEPTAATHPQTPPSTPSTNRDDGDRHSPSASGMPSTNGNAATAAAAKRQKRPSPNGEIQRPPKRAGFDWLDEWRRAFGGLAPS